MHASDPHSHSLKLTRPQNVQKATLFLRNTKQYNHLSYFLPNSPLEQPRTSAGDSKGAADTSGSHFCESLFSSSVAFLMMSVASKSAVPSKQVKTNCRQESKEDVPVLPHRFLLRNH